MAKVEIKKELKEEIFKKFKAESKDIFELIHSLEKKPHKGKPLGTVGGVVIKELKYKNYRFYFITDGYKLKVVREKDLIDLIIRFIRMSDKKDQQKTINEIRKILIKLGPKGLK